MKSITALAQKITKTKIFKSFIFSLILLSTLLTGIETYSGLASQYSLVLKFLDKFVVFWFTVEIILKIVAEGKKPWSFFSDPWNIFDFIIVAVCLIPAVDTHFFAVLRILRVLRVLRMITFFPKLRLLIGALLKSIPSMGYVILLLSILFYVYAIVGVFSFGRADPVNFGDLHHTLVTLFKVLTLEGWTDIMNTHLYGPTGSGNHQIVSVLPFIYFASFILIGAMIIMNLFIGVIMNSMEESQNEMAQELQEMKFKGKSSEELYLHIISKLDDLENEIKSLKKVHDK